MSAPNLVKRNDLLEWANTVAASSELPRLVRRLILETGRGVVQLGFPAGEGIRAGSWDGTLRSTEAVPYIPPGLSVWELSVEKSPGTKADKDYNKRETTPDGSPTSSCTYVEVILRPWTNRQTWARERTAQGRWSEVRALGVDDIETWLENAPVTHAWISQLMGRNPYGLRPVDLWWDTWASSTTPMIEPSFILAGRSKEHDELLARIKGPAQVTTIKGGSPEEMQSFISAVMLQAEINGDDQPKARAAFVNDLTTWRELLARPNPLILIAASEQTRTEPPPPASVHHIIIPLIDAPTADIEMPSIDPTEAAPVLKQVGLDDQRADKLARLARRSLLAMRREIASKPELHQPPWARPPIDRVKRSLLLAGRWREDQEGDKEVLVALAGSAFDDVRERSSELASEGDPFLGHVGAVWSLVSAHDAWGLLARQLRADDLERLNPVVQEVLGEADPALDLPKGERWWRASLEGRVRKYSSHLRDGLVSTLALLGIYGDLVDAGSGSNGVNWTSAAVGKLLDRSNGDKTCKLWISLSTLLPLLAEAAPDEFLGGVQKGLEGSSPLLSGLFEAEVSGSIGGFAPHTGLLWALESVAWSGPHFGRSVDLLAQLAEIDPGGRLSNRPAASLATIFNPWHPDNSVDVDRRLRVLDALRKRHPNVAWDLMLTMLPESHSMHFPAHEPTFRMWKPAKIIVTYGEYFSVITEVVMRLVRDTGTDAGRWANLIQQISNLTPADREAVLEALRQHVDNNDFSADETSKLWESLRSVTSRHREYSDSVWALPEGELDKIDQVQSIMQPRAPMKRDVWLFQDYNPTLPGYSIAADFQAYTAALDEFRKNAVNDIDESGGYDALLQLARDATQAWWVGVAIADAIGTKYAASLLSLIGSDDAIDADLSAGYMFRRFSQVGWQWLEELLKSEPPLTSTQKAILLLQTHDYPKAWQRADELGEEVADQFWRRFRIYGLGEFFDIAEAATRLTRVNRNATALQLIEIYAQREDANVEQLVEIGASTLEARLHTDDPEIGILRQYDFQQLFNLFYENETTLGWERIARLEWQYLPALGYDADPRMLGRLLARDPNFFVELVSVVFRPASAQDAPQPSADEERRAANAYRLLDEWSVTPGMQENGHVDGVALSEWVSQALSGLRKADRFDDGAQAIGRVLATAPSDANGNWPSSAVRDLFDEQRLDQLENGFYIAILNNRGITTRSLEAGGDQERILAAKFRADAEQYADEWPRTAALLRSLAEFYERDARGEDSSAERFRRGMER